MVSFLCMADSYVSIRMLETSARGVNDKTALFLSGRQRQADQACGVVKGLPGREEILRGGLLGPVGADQFPEGNQQTTARKGHGFEENNERPLPNLKILSLPIPF